MLALTEELVEIDIAPARDLEQPHQPSTQLPRSPFRRPRLAIR